jgi:hypothetical protein
MNVVISFIGQMPAYLYECVRQLRLFFKGRIYIIYSQIDSELLERILCYNLDLVHYDIVKSERFDSVFSTNDFIVAKNIPERKFLFLRSYERLFLIDNLIRLYDLEHVWSIEVDILMYIDPSKFIDVLKEKPYVYSFHNDDHCNISILYVRDKDGLRDVLYFFENYKSDSHLSEMKAMFNYYKMNPDDMLFPLIYSCYLREELHRTFSKFNCIFDAASTGQYLFGIEKAKTNMIPLQNSTDGITGNLKIWRHGSIEWIASDDILLPYLKPVEGASVTAMIPIVNLHIHSKNLIAATSYRKEEEFDVITVYESDEATVSLIKNIRTYLCTCRKIYMIGAPSGDGYVCINDAEFPFTRSEAGFNFNRLARLYCGLRKDVLDNFLFLDSDVSFIKSLSFFTEGQLLFPISRQNHVPYFKHMSSLIPGLSKVTPYSGNCYLQPMRKHIVNCLITSFEIPFYKAFLLSDTKMASIDEILFNFALQNYKKECVLIVLGDCGRWRTGGRVIPNNC